MHPETEQFTVLQALVHRPTMYLEELRDHLYKVTGVYVSPATLCRTIKQNDFTRKKVETIALQRSETQRIEYIAERGMYDPDMFIWVDESGSDRRKEIRQYGYSLRGMPPSFSQLRVGGHRISALPVMTTRGIEDVFTTTGSVNGEDFVQFIRKYILPIILPFNGTNPRSIIIMDNASIHHLDQVYEIITGVGARLCFLPPYSPDLMPLEKVFSKVKYVLKNNDYAYLSTSRPEELVKLAFCTITVTDCQNYIRECGYV